MAFAYRKSDEPRRVFIELESGLDAATDISLALIIKSGTYKLEAFERVGRLIRYENKGNVFDSLLLNAAQEDYIGLAVLTKDGETLLFIEQLRFNYSFFTDFFDFARNTDLYFAQGHYAKAGSLAVFTHVYNDNSMLRLWEGHYARIVPAGSLYVIDHGSLEDPRDAVSRAVNVVSVPRGPVDHRAISHFCSTFQRFLLSQHRWVMHVDADELLVHRRGCEYFRNSLLERPNGAIVKAGHGYHLVHDIGAEPAIDLSAPISLQRNRLVSDHRYAKPVLSSVPTTWREGFHGVMESHALVEDEELWLIHLSFADIGLHLDKSLKWSSLDVAEVDRLMSPLCYDRPATTVARAERLFSQMLEGGPTVAVPDWMRGMF